MDVENLRYSTTGFGRAEAADSSSGPVICVGIEGNMFKSHQLQSILAVSSLSVGLFLACSSDDSDDDNGAIGGDSGVGASTSIGGKVNTSVAKGGGGATSTGTGAVGTGGSGAVTSGSGTALVGGSTGNPTSSVGGSNAGGFTGNQGGATGQPVAGGPGRPSVWPSCSPCCSAGPGGCSGDGRNA